VAERVARWKGSRVCREPRSASRPLLSFVPVASENTDRLQALWVAVDELLAEATLAGILAHRMGPLAARGLRRRGEPLPAPLALEERAAALCNLVARSLLERVRATSEAPIILIKGPEVASSYPGRARGFGDVDILTRHAPALQHALLAAGFVEDYDPRVIAAGIEHHLMPLKWPTLEFKIEVHGSPNWPGFLVPPPMDEILEGCVPSACGVVDVSAPAPAHHALIIAAHAWYHEPLWTLRDLVDIAAISAHADERELDRTAERWGMHRLWRTTQRATDALFYGGRKTFPLRTWARHLELVRDRTGFEGHLTRLLSGYWAMPPKNATTRTTQVLHNLVAPNPGETWRDKARRLPGAFQKLRAPEERPDPAMPPADGPDSP
jgi:hypothetical protein